MSRKDGPFHIISFHEHTLIIDMNAFPNKLSMDWVSGGHSHNTSDSLSNIRNAVGTESGETSGAQDASDGKVAESKQFESNYRYTRATAQKKKASDSRILKVNVQKDE